MCQNGHGHSWIDARHHFAKRSYQYAHTSAQAMIRAGSDKQIRLFLGMFYAVMLIFFVLSFAHQKALYDNMHVGGRDLALCPKVVLYTR
jgi:hypothetical protein